MKINFANILKLLISIGLGVGLVFWFVGQMTPEQKLETIDSFKRADYFWLFFPLIVGLSSNLMRAQRWRLLLRPLGYNPGYMNTFYSIMVMFFANLFIPRLGEVTRCGVLAKYDNVPVEKSIGTMVVERVIDLLSILVLLGILMIFEYELLLDFFKKTVLNKEAAEAPNLWMKYGIPLAIVAFIGAVSVYIIRKKGFSEWKAAMIEKFSGLWAGIKSIRYLQNFPQFVLLTIGIWAAYFLMTYLSFRALEETSNLGPLVGLACLIFGGFAMVATPGGIGAYPLMVRAVLLLYGVAEVTGGALGTMLWATQTLGVFLGGILALTLLALSNSKSQPKA